jgi:hypothetical protein
MLRAKGFRARRISTNRNSGRAKAGPATARTMRPSLEFLETRVLLSFSAPVSYNIGSSATVFNGSVGADGVATGDFNGDGKVDLAVVHGADNTVNILLGKGDGTFAPPVSYPTGHGGSLWVTVADLNGDGKQDLVLLGSNGNAGSVSIMLGDGDGTFKPAVAYVSGGVSRGGVVVADFNGDGKPDLALAQFAAISSNQSAVDIFINNGDGTFKPYYVVGVWPAARSVTTGDFNGDGKADLAVADGLGVNNTLDPTYPAGVTILLGNGNGTFTTAGQLPAPPTPDAGNDGKGGGDTVNPEFITTADLNHDGKLDLVESLYDHNVDVFLGNGNGTFQPAMGFNTGEYPRALVLADLNHDGNLDLVVGNIGLPTNPGGPEPGSVAVLYGNGNGTFQPAVQYTPFNFPGWVAVGDFNGDGAPDIAATRVSDGHSVGILLNQTPAATFVHSDATTQGSWTGTYGADGYSIIGGTTALPSYATLSVSGQQFWQWATSTSDLRDPQASRGSVSRVAAADYSGSSFTLNVNFTDVKAHQVSLYLLDWDHWNRAEQVQVTDADTGAVLETRQASNFGNGQWLVFDLTGDVNITLTNTGYPNAVLSAIAFDPVATAATAAASFVGVDSTHQGSWTGVYGAQGYSVIGGNTSLPGSVVLSVSGQQYWPWGTSTSDVRDLQVSPGSTSRVAACDYSGSSFSLDLNLADGQAHQVAFYVLDWDNLGRMETVSVSDAGTGALLDSRTVSSFAAGDYLVWDLSGHVKVTFTNASPSSRNAVLSGVFIDAVPASAAASFLGADTSTRGTWTGVYGGDGYQLFGGGASLPNYASLVSPGTSNYVWASGIFDPRALQTGPASPTRLAACDFSPTSFALDLNLTDGKSHRVALYMVDWDNRNRAQSVQITDAASGAPLDTRQVSQFFNGEYLVWTLTGHVKITITNAGGLNAVASGIFFG